MQTTASTPKIKAEQVHAEEAATLVAAPFVHKRFRQALELPLPFKLTAVVVVSAVIALALLLQA